MTPEQLAELKARASRPRRTVPIVCNGDLAEQIQSLTDELVGLDRPANDRRLSSKSNAAKVTDLEAQLDELYERAAGDTLLIVVEGLPGTDWRALLAQHPPRLDGDGKSLPGWDTTHRVNRESLEEPLIRAAVIGQRSTVDSPDVEALPDGTLDWLLGRTEPPAQEAFATIEQRESLFLAAWNAGRGDDAVPLRRRRSTTPTSDGE